ncbi:hypothetical protein GCM10010123_26890 [Pilimelia anulata]|uniref:Peptidase S8/S53 domain-containing protein n=1 Tax=Pilimelia anulata TaxID=53371 RepID=A0A8J3B5H7_9ACTN|nr:S8 family serine peptidase [Pilimelia anulata]GGJ95648.1 hypothetical protein GCM10010123_26890 [Pilimelia anulata]
MRAAAGFAAVLCVLVPPPAPAAAACRPDPAPLTGANAPSWAQRALAPERVAPFADGTGVVVAVLDSGVDRRHPQLRDALLTGGDFLGGGAGAGDCAGHGTGVAGLIAAAPGRRSALRGLAPGARILPVRVSERRTVDGRPTGRAAAPARVAAAIRWAVRRGADVLNLSLALPVDEPAVRSAIAAARRADVVVVAAAGGPGGNYPAAYPGVLGVGATGPTGERDGTGPGVDLVAPGRDVLSTWPGGYARLTGPSFAAPYAAATAALVRQRWPRLTADAVVDRLLATADPAPGDPAAYGRGALNPYRAVTEADPGPAAPGGPATLPPHRVDPAEAARGRYRGGRADLALRLGAAGGVVLVLAVLAALVRSHSRDRRRPPRRRPGYGHRPEPGHEPEQGQ